MDSYIFDPREWAEANFGGCEFGDKRLTDCLVDYAESVSVRPDESTPHQRKEGKPAGQPIGSWTMTRFPMR